MQKIQEDKLRWKNNIEDKLDALKGDGEMFWEAPMLTDDHSEEYPEEYLDFSDKSIECIKCGDPASLVFEGNSLCRPCYMTKTSVVKVRSKKK
jgi:hypothetical protein